QHAHLLGRAAQPAPFVLAARRVEPAGAGGDEDVVDAVAVEVADGDLVDGRRLAIRVVGRDVQVRRCRVDIAVDLEIDDGAAVEDEARAAGEGNRNGDFGDILPFAEDVAVDQSR